jgi:cell division protein FtsZ
MEDLLDFGAEKKHSSIIKVIGVGGGGSNAVNYMHSQGINDVDFVVCNTDAQALADSSIKTKIQLGATLTEGLGAGNQPEQGKEAAVESINDLESLLSDNTKMVFITAGMGGGTGTGAAPVIANTAKEKGILTIGIVTIPFKFEGKRRITQAVDGIAKLKENVDSLLVIDNEKLREIYGDLKVSDAFANADNVLTVAAKGIAEIITVHGQINVDFADVQTVMKDSGVAIMGNGISSGENRAIEAIKEALTSPLLNSNDIRGAKNILLNISSGTSEVTMDEVGEISDYVQERAGLTADLILGSNIDEKLGDSISVTLIATGFTSNDIPEMRKNIIEKVVKDLDDNEIPKTRDLDPNPSKSTTVQKEEYAQQGTIVFNEQADMSDTLEKLKNLSDVKNDHLVDELESESAFSRRKKANENQPQVSDENEDSSRFTLSEDEDGNVKLRENNSFLHDNVD